MAQELGTDETFPISQKAVSNNLPKKIVSYLMVDIYYKSQTNSIPSFGMQLKIPSYRKVSYPSSSDNKWEYCVSLLREYYSDSTPYLLVQGIFSGTSDTFSKVCIISSCKLTGDDDLYFSGFSLNDFVYVSNKKATDYLLTNNATFTNLRIQQE